MPDLTSALRVAVIQSELVWQNAVANRQHFEEIISQQTGVDVIVLPEMFTTGFSMDSEQIAEPEGETLAWLLQQAKQYKVALVGSVAVQLANGCVNRCYFVTPEGESVFYDKKHLFRMAGEHLAYQAGNERVVIDWRGMRFCLQVCYDLRFPVFSRNRGDYDVLIYVANWPAVRSHAWRTLLKARAIENQAYVIGCNRVGQDENQLQYGGDSLIVNYLGQIMAELPPHQSGIVSGCLEAEKLLQFRQKFPAHLDADPFSLL